MKSTIFLSLLSMSVAVSANPLGLTSYKQSFTVDFPDGKSAAEATVVPRGLPGKYTVAFSSRWDDSSMSHCNTHAAMKKHGAKGNFYIIGKIGVEIPVLPHIIRDGCLAGAHTAGHHPIKYFTANHHFYEYMSNRIAVEVQSQTPVNTQTAPYGNYNGHTKEGTVSIGKAVLATGIIGSPDGRSPEHIKAWGYPANSCAFMYRVVPGDRDPSMKKLDAMLKSHLNNPDFKKDPAISMSTHSWHTRKGLVTLDEIYKKLASNPDWWNCNQNEYAAYRYEALNTQVSKEVTGKTVKFTVTRVEPFELGADVPLYFDIVNATASSVSGAELKDGGKQIKLPHAAGHVLPEKYGYQTLDKVSVKLTVSESDGKMTAEIKNAAGGKISEVSCIFRKPPMYGKVVERIYLKEVGAEKTVSVDTGKVTKKNRHFTIGKAYYAVQLDYTVDGKRRRIYADCSTAERKFEEKTLGEAVVYFRHPAGKIDGKELSQINAPLTGMEKLEHDRSINLVSGTVYPGKVGGRPGYIAVADIVSEDESILPVKVNAAKSSRIYFNGEEYTGKRTRKIKFAKGVNRLVISGERQSANVFDISGKVQYLTPSN